MRASITARKCGLSWRRLGGLSPIAPNCSKRSSATKPKSRKMVMCKCLSTLVVVLLLSGTVRADEAAALKLVKQLDGKITRDETQPGKPAIVVSVIVSDLTDEGLKELMAFTQLKELKL